MTSKQHKAPATFTAGEAMLTLILLAIAIPMILTFTPESVSTILALGYVGVTLAVFGLRGILKGMERDSHV